jgi:hypothetical protein
MSWTSLLRRQGRLDDARDLLGPTYGWIPRILLGLGDCSVNWAQAACRNNPHALTSNDQLRPGDLRHQAMPEPS